MSVAIELQIATDYKLDLARLTRSAQVTLQNHRRDDCGLSIVIADNDTVRNLNQQYRQMNSVTDVLSFPTTSTQLPNDCLGSYLGDIIIAYPYAREQAQLGQVKTGDALNMLVVHGTLHLLGYDHDTGARRKRMWAAQSRALQALRIDPELVSRYGGLVRE